MDYEQSSVRAYARNVFVNCPFDAEYFPLLKAMLWVLVYVGLRPRLALERSNAGEGRLAKIHELIEESKYGIHDLSRLKAKQQDEFYRLNMPFELGIDYACKIYSAQPGYMHKVLLVLEGDQYSAHKALSDISFTDPKAHHHNPQHLVTALRNWLVENKFEVTRSAGGLWRAYNEFYSELTYQLIKLEWTDKEIEEMPIAEYLDYLQSG